jgi:RimJ/RimL family protein N-acetyltransferase
MNQIPTIATSRLVLRPFALADAPVVKELAGAWEVADTTGHIPHPYEDGVAEAWISSHQKTFDDGDGVTFAIVRSADHQLLGAISISIHKAYHLAEIGYWIGKPYWQQGYCTEAARAVLDYAFETLDLNRVQAHHLTRNPASGRVMQKVGMTLEGVLRQAIYRWNRFDDLAIYSVLRSEYSTRTTR